MENNVTTKGPNFFVKIANSVQGLKHMDTILKETTGKAILYLLLVSLIFGVFSSIRPAIEINSGISGFIKMFNDKCPNFEISDGELKVDEKMPLDLSENGYYFVIDTTNSTNPDVLDKYSEGILLLKDRYIQKNNGRTQSIDFSSFNNMTIDKEKVNRFLPLAKMIVPLIFLGNFLKYFLGGLISALILGILALIINGAFNTGLEFNNLYAISIYALTMPMIIDVIFSIFSIPYFKNFLLFYHAIGFLYICYALYNLKKTYEAPKTNY